MKEFLQRLFIGHVHQWEERSSHEIVHEDGTTIGLAVIMRCSVCGTLKTFKVMG